jgi:REP element-mobilizing transposase RayT
MYHTQTSGKTHHITWRTKYLVSCLVKKGNDMLRFVKDEVECDICWECISDGQTMGQHIRLCHGSGS